MKKITTIFFIISFFFLQHINAQPKQNNLLFDSTYFESIHTDTIRILNIHSIKISGNKKTKDYIILREMQLKIGQQIKSTIGYENVIFGGGIIGYRDRNFDFLKPLSEYNDTENDKLLVPNFIINCYSEFRRHTEVESQEKIKFLLIYYLPNSNIKPDDIKNAKPETVENKNEVFFVLTTKFATDEEVNKITSAFKTVTPMIFHFNNCINQ